MKNEQFVRGLLEVKNRIIGEALYSFLDAEYETKLDIIKEDVAVMFAKVLKDCIDEYIEELRGE